MKILWTVLIFFMICSLASIKIVLKAMSVNNQTRTEEVSE